MMESQKKDSFERRILLVYAVHFSFQNPISGVAPPCGLSWIAQALEHSGYRTSLCDISLAGDKTGIIDRLHESIDEFAPHAIGLSIRNINTSVNPPFSFLPFLKFVMNTIRKSTQVPVILGGAGFSLLPELCMNSLDADFGLVGEGERTFPLLLDSIFKNGDKLSIPGLVFKNGKRIERTESAKVKDFPPLEQALHRGIDYGTYAALGGHFAVQTKRGCCFRCIYCNYPYLEGREFRRRTPSSVIEEIQQLLEKKSMNAVFFTDSVFNIPVSLCSQILKEIISQRIDIRWRACVNPLFLTKELIEMFKKSGCSGLEVTIDTASTQTLRSYQKDFTIEDIFQADHHLHTFEIPTFYWVNLGGPGETGATLRETLTNLGRLKQVTKGFISKGLVILPGTPLQESINAKNKSADLPGDISQVYISPFLPDDFAEQIQSFCIHHPQWNSQYDSVRDEYNTMRDEIVGQRLRNHWQIQREYGKVRKEKFDQGIFKILSENDFQGLIRIDQGMPIRNESI